jgi:isochorismate pyruvate lyase
MRQLFFALMLVASAVAARAEEPTTSTPAFWGSPTVNNGACCSTLAEVRQNIDRIDRELVRLMAERGRYVHEASRFKANPAQVEAPETCGSRCTKGNDACRGKRLVSENC